MMKNWNTIVSIVSFFGDARPILLGATSNIAFFRFWKLPWFPMEIPPYISTNLPFPTPEAEATLVEAEIGPAQVGYHPAIDVSNLLYFGFLGSI